MRTNPFPFCNYLNLDVHKKRVFSVEIPQLVVCAENYSAAFKVRLPLRTMMNSIPRGMGTCKSLSLLSFLSPIASCFGFLYTQRVRHWHLNFLWFA